MTVFSHLSERGFSNAFVIASAGEAVVVDPGSFDRHMLLIIEENRLRIRSVLLTHWHRSHVEGLRTMRRIYDFDTYSYLPGNTELRCREVREGSTVPVGGIEAQCLETPGHSVDSVCYRIGDCLFTGDTLMAGEIGSTAEPKLRHRLIESIWSRILCWPEDTLIFAGHGPPSRVGVERMFNPYLVCGWGSAGSPDTRGTGAEGEP